jgi:hypothetical protein
MVMAIGNRKAGTPQYKTAASEGRFLLGATSVLAAKLFQPAERQSL